MRVVGPELAFAGFEDFFDFAGADHGIHFGDLFADVVAIALDHASGDDQFLRAAEFFVFGHFQDGLHGFLLRGLDEAAGIDDQHVGFAGARREFVAGARENAHHHLAIHEVLRASQADESDFRHTARSLGCCGIFNFSTEAWTTCSAMLRDRSVPGISGYSTELGIDSKSKQLRFFLRLRRIPHFSHDRCGPCLQPSMPARTRPREHVAFS